MLTRRVAVNSQFKKRRKVTKNLKKFGYLKFFLLFCSVEKSVQRHRKHIYRIEY